MTKIYFWGDSWGVPTEYQLKNFTSNGHLQNLLKNAGYDVVNLCKNGSGNYNSLSASKNLPQPDYVIWFHAEMHRDINKMMNKFKIINYGCYIDESLHKIADCVYKQAHYILKQWSETKLIVLQSQSPIVEPEFSKWLSPYNLYDWRNKLYTEEGKKLEKCYYLRTYTKINTDIFIDDQKDKNALLKIVDQHHAEMSMNRKNFPDKGHPGDLAHKELFNHIVNLI